MIEAASVIINTTQDTWLTLTGNGVKQDLSVSLFFWQVCHSAIAIVRLALASGRLCH